LSSNDTNDADGTKSNSNENNNAIIQLELTDEVKQQEIVTGYVFDPEIDSLTIELNHKYSKKKITSHIESAWPKTMDTLIRQLQRKKISPEHITMLCDVADNAGDKILKMRRNKCAEKEKEEEDSQNLESTSQKLLSLAKEQCQELFVDQYGEPYAAVKIKEHLETLNLNHMRFRNWICKAYYEIEGSIPNSESITNALNILEANAEFDGKIKELHLRVAYDTSEEEGTTQTIRTTIFCDLTNKEWEAIKIAPEKWTIEKAPILFRRHNAQPHVYPAKNYPPDIFDKFMKLLNVKGDGRQLLLKCYIITLFIPEIDKPILMLHGDPGGAKFTLQELVKTLVDPSSVLTFALPRDIFELVQQLDHNHVAYYDNISRIPDWISDQFCRASTGGGSSKRRLYTDDDDKIYNFKRCVGFNGVNLAATKSDLLDRGLIIRVERIDDKVKQKKEKIWQEFEKLRPQLLGYIFDVLVKVLEMRQTTSIEFEKLPRMADFAEVAEIISRCMGNKDNQFIDAYYDNIKLQTEEILETSLVASAILKFMDDRKEWNGNATELLEQLDHVVSQKTLKNKFWPKASNSLSRRMNEVKTNLREVGLVIEEGDADPKTRVKTIMITNSDPTEDSFWQVFEGLESTADNNIIDYDRLKASLCQSGRFDNSHAVLIIAEMQEHKKIEDIGLKRYRRMVDGSK
jgi:DNA-binding transcriptional MerR regulator